MDTALGRATIHPNLIFPSVFSPISNRFNTKKNLKTRKGIEILTKPAFFNHKPQPAAGAAWKDALSPQRKPVVASWQSDFLGGFFFPNISLGEGGEEKKKTNPKQQYFWTSLPLYSLRKLFPTYTPGTVSISLANARHSGISPGGVCIPWEIQPSPGCLGTTPTDSPGCR